MPTTLARGCSGKGRRSWGYTGFYTLSTPLPLPSLSLSPSFTQGFGTERARLVVQVKRPRCTRHRHRTCKTSGSSKIAFYAASRLTRALRFARGLKKSACYLVGFSLVVSKKVPATWLDFCSGCSKKCLLPGVIFIFSHRF